MPVVVQTRVDAGGGTAVQLAVLRTIAALDVRTTGFGSLQGASTLLTLDRPLLTYANAAGPLSDVRDFSITEVTSPPLQLQPVSAPDGGAFADGNGALAFHGTAREAQALAGRRLWLAGAAAGIELVCNNTPADFATPDPDAARMWPLAFDRPPLPFTRADFDETAPTVDVFGNLADATQGKAEREAVLGNGDNRQAWQTFALPKAPLTWFVSAGAFPPYVPELEVRVAGRAWTRVDAFYGHGAGDTVYVVREDAEGRAFVQFGDGTTGARLPSGLNNVVAVYRTGTGAHGPARPGSAPAAGERPPGFDKVALAGIVAGGAASEDAARARVTAPGKVQSLGRLVSIRDYETETLAVPGVVAAGAAWDLHAGVPAVLLRVLLAAGREAEFGAVRAALAHAQRCRGPDRFALVVEHAFPRHAFVDVRYARDPARSRADVEAAMRAALGLAGVAADERDGVFGLYARRLGEPEYASRIEGRLQNVDGVLWCEVSALGLCAPGADQADAPLPAAPRPRAAVLPCGPGELLQLAAGHLTLMPTAEPSPGECA
jgi:hypothetical protein